MTTEPPQIAFTSAGFGCVLLSSPYRQYFLSIYTSNRFPRVRGGLSETEDLPDKHMLEWPYRLRNMLRLVTYLIAANRQAGGAAMTLPAVAKRTARTDEVRILVYRLFGKRLGWIQGVETRSEGDRFVVLRKRKANKSTETSYGLEKRSDGIFGW